MKPDIKSTQEDNEYYFQEGCHIIEVSSSDSDEELSIARARVEPDMTTAWHSLKETTERYIILEGCGSVEIGELPPREVRPGDVVIIPKLTRQRIHNHNDTDLIFLAVCVPPFRIENYLSLDD